MLGDFAHWVENAGLAVGSHGGYQQNIRTYHLSEPVEIDESARRHRDDVHLGLPRIPEPGTGLGDGGVFHRRDQDPMPVGRSRFDCPRSTRLFASVAPEVKTTPDGRPPTMEATCSRASSTAAACRRPKRWTEEAFPSPSVRARTMVSPTRGSSGAEPL